MLHPAAYLRKSSPSTTPPAVFSRKSSPGTPQAADCGPFFVRWANFFALASAPGRAGRTFSCTGTCDGVTLKPMTPLQPLMQTNVKPPSPLRPKTTPKTPISHPQRRWRFQLGLSLREQRRWRFHLRPALRPQRRRRFHARDLRCLRAMVRPGCGGCGRRRGLAGLRGEAQAHVSTPGPTGVKGAGGHWRAWLWCRWAVAGPGRASRRRAEPKARSADGERAGRRPRAHKVARPSRGHKRPSGTGRRHDPRLGGQGTQS